MSGSRSFAGTSPDAAAATQAAAVAAAKVPAAVAKLLGGLAKRSSAPCRIVFTGSSTTAGTAATLAEYRWVNRFVTMVQAAYPSGLGVETTVVDSASADFGTLSAAAGVHGYNAGQGGTQADTYLTGTEITKVAALNPRAVFHMVGSNDFALGYAPATYKANLLAVITSLKAQIAGPCVHILVHPYERYDSVRPYAWSAYGQAMAEIAAADPNNVAFVDISAAYYLLGVPSTDPLTLMHADAVHQVDAGHALMADLVRRGLAIPGGGSTAAAASTVVNGRLTSDAFTGGDAADLIGRATDVVLGGATRTWVGDGATCLAISSGVLVRGANTTPAFFVGLPLGVMDVEVSIVVPALPTGTDLLFDLHRQAAVIAGSPATYRMLVAASGLFALGKRAGGGAISVLTSSYPYVAGDRLTLRYYKGVLEGRKNGLLITAVADTSITTPGYTGVGGAPTLTACSVDNLTLDALT